MSGSRVILTGRLVKDPEMRYTKDEVPVARFVVAVKGVGKGKIEYFDCVAWRGLANIVGEYCKKGSMVAIEGKREVKKYMFRGKKKERAEILVDNMLMMDTKFYKTMGCRAIDDKKEGIVMTIKKDNSKQKVIKVSIGVEI